MVFNFGFYLNKFGDNPIPDLCLVHIFGLSLLPLACGYRMITMHFHSNKNDDLEKTSRERLNFFFECEVPFFQNAGFLFSSKSDYIPQSSQSGGWIFPLHPCPTENIPQEPEPLRKKLPGVFRILMAEDSKEQQVFVRFLLKGMTYTIDFADNGIQALELFQQGQYDLVFMDMRMPKMDGWEATRRIREWESHRSDLRVPIIALTGLSGRDEIQKCRDAGCTDHLAKPFSQKDFFKKLE